MRAYLISVTAFLFVVVAACSTTSGTKGECEATSIEQVIADPMRYAGQRFCGDALVARAGQITRIMGNADDVEGTGTVIAPSRATEHLLGSVGPRPTRYQIEAKIIPMADCFPPETVECVPIERPVEFGITRARRIR